METPNVETSNKTEMSQSNSGNIESLVIMGDSIGYAIGDEEGLGIGQRYLNLVKKNKDIQTEIDNISVPGYESDDLATLIKSKENQTIISNADLIIISIGGNDLNRLEYKDELTMSIAFKEAINNYKDNLELIINDIKMLNPNAQLAFIGLYDPFDKKEPEKTKFLLEWNYETRLIIDKYIKFCYVPTYEEFEYHINGYLSADRFHPSAKGYQVIAEILYRILN